MCVHACAYVCAYMCGFGLSFSDHGMLGVGHEELVSLAEKHFAGLSSSNERIDVAPSVYTGSEVGLSSVLVCIVSMY